MRCYTVSGYQWKGFSLDRDSCCLFPGPNSSWISISEQLFDIEEKRLFSYRNRDDIGVQLFQSRIKLVASELNQRIFWMHQEFGVLRKKWVAESDIIVIIDQLAKHSTCTVAETKLSANITCEQKRHSWYQW